MRDDASCAVPHSIFVDKFYILKCIQKISPRAEARGDELLPLYDIVCDGRPLILAAIEMCERLKASLLVADGHECLAINDGCSRLDAMVFAQVDLIYVNLLLIGT